MFLSFVYYYFFRILFNAEVTCCYDECSSKYYNFKFILKGIDNGYIKGLKLSERLIS